MTSETPPALPDTVRTAILRSLPDADLDTVDLLGAGIATTAYRFADPSGRWVARVSNDYPEPWTWRGGRKYEVPLLRELFRLGLPVARDPFEVIARDGRPVAIVEREVDGVPSTELPAERRTDLPRQLADFLGVLHSVPVESARAIGVPESEILVELGETFDAAASRLDHPTRKWIEYELDRVDRPDLPRVPIHADFRPDHWYCDQSGSLVGVIDFGDSTIGDPALDFARIPDEFGAAFLEHLAANYRGPTQDGIVERARIYRALQPLFEVVGADDVAWWDRGDALRQLSASAAAAGFGGGFDGR